MPTSSSTVQASRPLTRFTTPEADGVLEQVHERVGDVVDRARRRPAPRARAGTSANSPRENARIGQ